MGPRTAQERLPACRTACVRRDALSEKSCGNSETPKEGMRNTVVRIPQSIYLTTVYRSKRAVRVITNALPKRQFCPFHTGVKDKTTSGCCSVLLRRCDHGKPACVRTCTRVTDGSARPPLAVRAGGTASARPRSVCLVASRRFTGLSWAARASLARRGRY